MPISLGERYAPADQPHASPGYAPWRMFSASQPKNGFMHILKDIEPKFVIIGAGATGMGAAWRLLQRKHRNWLVLEQNPQVGGLAATFEDQKGFCWDISGKVLYDRYAEFKAFLERQTRKALEKRKRKYYIHVAGRDVPCPFQNNLHYLPEPVRQACLEDLDEAVHSGEQPDRRNYLTWSRSRLGDTITNLIVKPENEKRWTVPLDQISSAWLSEKVRPVDIDRIHENIRQERDDVCWEPNVTFRFPRKGGVGSLFEAMSMRAGRRLCLNRRVVEINRGNRIIYLQDGERIKYDHLLSTMPIDRLISMVTDAPDALIDSAAGLEHTNGYFVGIGLRGQAPHDHCRTYVPDPASPFFRVSWFSNFSKYNVPDDDHYSLICDISHSRHRRVNKATIIEDCIQSLLRTGILPAGSRKHIVATSLIDAGYTYPVPTLNRDAILDEIQEWLESVGIFSRGRFGSWLYEIGNMDQAFMMGLQWVDWVLKGKRQSIWLDRQ